MIHKFKVEPIENAPVCARVTIDDKPIRCRGYEIKHRSGEIPTVELEILSTPDCELDAIIDVSNAAELARIMDKEQFDKFCELWEEIHTCEAKSK